MNGDVALTGEDINIGGGGISISDTVDALNASLNNVNTALDTKQPLTSSLTAETAIADADYIPFYDASASANRKSTWANIIAKLRTAFFGTANGVLKANGAGVISVETNIEPKKLLFTNKSVAVSSFVADTTYADYPFRAAIALDGVLSNMIPEVMFDVPDAVSGNYSPVSDTYDGGVYIYAASKPDAAITIPTIICWRGA